jgi:hypothetical protein
MKLHTPGSEAHTICHPEVRTLLSRHGEPSSILATDIQLLGVSVCGWGTQLRGFRITCLSGQTLHLCRSPVWFPQRAICVKLLQSAIISLINTLKRMNERTKVLDTYRSKSPALKHLSTCDQLCLICGVVAAQVFANVLFDVAFRKYFW